MRYPTFKAPQFKFSLGMTLLGPKAAAASVVVSSVMRGEKRVACKGNHNATVNV